MIHRLSIVLALGVLNASADKEPPRQDLLRFSNGDQLHGRFAGIGTGSKISWERKDVSGAIELSSSEVRQVVLNGGRPKKSMVSLSCVTLVDGDRIPGVLKSLDDTSVVLETSFAGIVTLPRDRVAMVAPSPLGGRLIYHGPYEGEEWSVVNMSALDGVPAESAGQDVKDDPTKPGNWKFSGSAWYWEGGRPGSALVRKEGMPDRSVLRFNLAWKNRMSLAFAFHADFKRPAAGGDEAVGNAPANPFSADASSFPKLFGSSYILQMSGNSVLLYRAGFEKDGKPSVEAIRSNSYSARLGETDNVAVELRCNRQSGEISLFINDEFFGQWSEGPSGAGTSTYSGKGGGFGYMVQSMDSPVRISDIVMAEWNGMPDSARSLQVEDQDIVLLANGTDRFSGKITGFKEGVIQLDGRYGAFRFPLNDLAEIRFARGRLAKPLEATAGEMTIHFAPLGRVSGRPIEGSASQLRLATPSAGEWNVDLAPATILDFNPSNSFLDDWDDQF
jgi:hypothetical protein